MFYISDLKLNPFLLPSKGGPRKKDSILWDDHSPFYTILKYLTVWESKHEWIQVISHSKDSPFNKWDYTLKQNRYSINCFIRWDWVEQLKAENQLSLILLSLASYLKSKSSTWGQFIAASTSTQQPINMVMHVMCQKFQVLLHGSFLDHTQEAALTALHTTGSTYT